MQRILIIRFSSIGDIVLTTPVIRCIKKKFGANVSIDYLTKAVYKDILINNAYIDTVYSIKNATKELESVLINNDYDYVIDLHKNVRSKAIAKKLGAEYSTFSKLNIKKWFLTNFKIDKLPKIHIVDRYFEATKKLGVVNDKQGIDYFLNKNDCFDIQAKFGITDFIAVAVGAQFATKQIPIEKLVAILSKTSLPIVLLGGKEDNGRANALVKKLNNKQLINLCGKLSINASASVLKQAKVLLTSDTGLMHIAAAFGIKIVSVWGNTVPKFGMYAYLPKQPQLLRIHEVKGLACRPCSKIGYKKCPKGHFNCMQLQNTTQIAADLDEI